MPDNCPKCGAVKLHSLNVIYGCGRAEADAAFYKQGDTTDCLRRQLAQAQAVIDKLPKDADGISVVPCVDTVWTWWQGGRCFVELGVIGGEWAQACHDDGGWCRLVSQCHSTREAAAAAKNKDATDGKTP